MAREKYETLTPLYHNASFSARGQMHDTRLGTTISGAERGNLTFNYSPTPLNYGNGPGNNGNLLQQNNIIPGSDTFRQDYDYDKLNRIKWVNEYKVVSGTPNHSFKQEFEYDVFGNRTINQATTSNSVPKPNFELQHPSGQTQTHNNRLCAPGDMNLTEANRLMQYDAAGNLTKDYYAPQVNAGAGGERLYDAENRMKEAWSGAPNLSVLQGKYTYDGDGRRIIRAANGVATWQVYGFEGELIAEYSPQFAAFVPQKEYGYQGGKLLITAMNGDEQRLTTWVQNLYMHTYGYLPAQSEIQDKVNALATAGNNADPNVFIQTAQGQAESLFSSAIYTNRNRNNYDYVRDLYAAYLQRPADPGGLAWWASQAANPANRYAVRQAFANPLAEITEGEFVDSEFGARLKDLRGNEASDTARTNQFINYIYFAVLNNSPEGVSVPGYSRSEAQELFNLANAKGQAETVTQAKVFVKALFNSSAYNALGKTPEQFVHDLYIAYLRFEDAPGAAWWTTQVGNNFQNKQAVIDAFANMPAFENQAKTLHREILWLIGDQLTSSRIIAERTGKLEGIKRHDFLPFGEEITAGTGGRTVAQGYSQPTGNREKWATYERDEETGLDYAQAHYYAPAQGRFTSPDEFTGGPGELFDFSDDAAANPTE